MLVEPKLGDVIYTALTGDWRLVVADGRFEIQPQVGQWQYASGINLDNLAALIIAAKADAIARGINWEGN